MATDATGTGAAADSLLGRIQASRRRDASRLGWRRRKRRDELQAALLGAIDELHSEGYGFALFWPSGKPLDRIHVARLLYWKLATAGVLQAEQAIGYEDLGDGR